MKKKVIINRQKLTREANLFPTLNQGIQNSCTFVPFAKEHSIEKVNGFWKINFKNK
ncbi:MAG: hypothetical protein V4520_02090 [Bacteroidota bacterium]